MPARVVVSLHFPSPLNVLLTIPGKYAVRLQNPLGPAGEIGVGLKCGQLAPPLL
jgi:hypothetical protein